MNGFHNLVEFLVAGFRLRNFRVKTFAERAKKPQKSHPYELQVSEGESMTVTRRAALVAPLAVIAIPGPVLAETQPDAALLALGERFDGLSAELARLDALARDGDDSAESAARTAYRRLGYVVEEIAAASAPQTLAGYRVQARAALWERPSPLDWSPLALAMTQRLAEWTPDAS